MPIYEYHCTTCGKDFEKMQSIKDEERLIDCVFCGNQAERKISITSYILTGSSLCHVDKNMAMKPCCSADKCCLNGACNIEK